MEKLSETQIDNLYFCDAVHDSSFSDSPTPSHTHTNTLPLTVNVFC